MKRIVLIYLFITTLTLLFGVPQSIDSARIVADNFAGSYTEGRQIIEEYEFKPQDKTLAYVFNLEPAGFIAVSADNDLDPVVAYSFRNRLKETDQKEIIFFQMLKNDLPFRLDYYSANPQMIRENRSAWTELLNGSRLNRDFQQWPAPGSTITDGWVETTWNQTGVFNQMCPLDNTNQRSVAGCVATAMAMIIDFHGEVGDVSFDDSDDYYSGWWNGFLIDDTYIERDYPSFPELNVYLEDLKFHYTNGMELTSTDKAALSFACGVSVEMSYSSSGSGASVEAVAWALLNKFDYDSAVWVENYNYTFFDQLKTNMMAMRPVELAIYQQDWSGGHAIIADGYNTNDYYHLNYGWGTSNSTCWYLIPEGMPSGYQNGHIAGAVMEIEGGVHPVEVTGYVYTGEESPVGTYIRLEGDLIFETYVEDTNGGFQIPAVAPGFYDISALLEDRVYYVYLEDVWIDQDNNLLQFDLGNYEAFTGVVSAPVDPEGCVINLYQDEIIAYQGIAGSSGEFSIPNVLPGIYQATASLNGDYFTAEEIEVVLDNQSEDFSLDYYPADISFSFAGFPDGIWSLGPDFTLSCAIKLTGEDLLAQSSDLIAGVRFKSPLDQDEGEIYVQLWQDDYLISEIEITEFSQGEWIETILPVMVSADLEKNYYVGYKIHSVNGKLAYHDSGPQQAGKGAFFRMSGWTALPATVNDFNFCIEAIFASQEYATITGQIALDGGEGNILDVAVKAGNYITHPDLSGNYLLDLKADDYLLTASLKDYNSASINLSLDWNDLLDDQNLTLTYGVAYDDDVIGLKTHLKANYPNPFNPETRIGFSLFGEKRPVVLVIYNLKGELVKTLINSEFDAGDWEVVWNGTDKLNNPVSSGLYLYRLDTGDFSSTRKMLLLK